MKKLKFYEVELWRAYVNDNTGVEGPITDYSLCIKGYFKPTILEAEQFLADDIRVLGYEGVTRVIEISEEEAYDNFNMENIIRPKIFGESKMKNEEIKNTKRIIDKSITFTEELISLLDGNLRTSNLELSQDFNDEIEILYNLKDKLQEVENNLYNPPKKVEFAIIACNRNTSICDELFSSVDLKDTFKRAESIEPILFRDKLRNIEGKPYDYLEVVQRDNHDVVYWRSYEETN